MRLRGFGEVEVERICEVRRKGGMRCVMFRNDLGLTLAASK
jgi:hypothetical protein